MIVYYTGTGNSRYVAEMLADLVGDEVVSANEYIKSGKTAVLESEKPYVFVSPVYVSAPARIFMDFIRKAELKGNKKVYFIMTCAGGMGGSPEYCRRLSAEKEFEYMGTMQIQMPQNYLVYFTTKEKEENDAVIAAAEPEIEKLAYFIEKAEAFPDSGMKKWEYISTEMILGMYYKWFMGTKKFAVSDECVSCGKCASVCPLNNIVLTDGKPVWGADCTHCMACINSCAKKAIEYGKASVGKPRYHCPSYKKK